MSWFLDQADDAGEGDKIEFEIPQGRHLIGWTQYTKKDLRDEYLYAGF